MGQKLHDTTIFKFSYSSMSLLKKCPREWFLRYVQQRYLPNPQAWTDFGLTVHEVSELYRGEGKARLIELAKQVIKEKGYKIYKDYRPKMPLALKNYKKYYEKFIEPAQKVKREMEFHTDLNEYVDLVGFVDILYKNEQGEWVIVDLKTSKNKGDHAEQLSLYYYLMCEITGQKPKKMKAQVVYLSLDSGSTDVEDFVEEYVLDYDDIHGIECRITGSMDLITNCGVEKTKYRKKPSALCNYCVYKKFGICNGVK